MLQQNPNKARHAGRGICIHVYMYNPYIIYIYIYSYIHSKYNYISICIVDCCGICLIQGRPIQKLLENTAL